MRLDRQGEDLTLRIPAALAAEMGSREGNEMRLEFEPERDAIRVRRVMTRAEALGALRRLARPFPPDVRFSRDEANERG